jgi:aspartokinase
MAKIVMKFGGTSVADVERIRNVARHVKREVDGGNEVAVVVSAMAGTPTSWSPGRASCRLCTTHASTTWSWPPANR